MLVLYLVPVVCFDQLYCAKGTQKLVEKLFLAFSDFFWTYFNKKITKTGKKIVLLKNVQKLKKVVASAFGCRPAFGS